MSHPLSREILCTVGPASLDARVLRRLEGLGVTLFRINLSHTRLKDLPSVVGQIRAWSKVPICLDSEGAQVRTADLVGGEIVVRENSLVRVHRDPVPGDASNFNFYPDGVVDRLEEGDFISIDFNAVLAQVVGKDTRTVTLRVIHGGVIGRNKAVTVERDIALPAMTAKDRAALAWGRTAGIAHVALSFANRGSDVDEVRDLVGADTFLISKIECRNGLIHLDDIARKSDALLIDRGDLSRQEPIERIPALQKTIIRFGNALGRKVYVATNLLESMIVAPRPTRAEVNDVVNTLLDGASGLVLAAETAIGSDPVGCVSMVVKLIREFENYRDGGVGVAIDYRPTEGTSFLPEPHGGRLVEQLAGPADEAAAVQLSRWSADERTLADVRAIALGLYSPLEGFLDQHDVESVVRRCRLADGTAWPVPVVLGVAASEAGALAAGQRIALVDGDGALRATLDVASVFASDEPLPDAGCITRFEPASPAGERRFVAGRVMLLRRAKGDGGEEMSPRETRFVFQHKGWQHVVGVQAQSVSDRFQEHAQRAALERIQGDGLFVGVPAGPRPAGHYRTEPILRSYHALIDFGHVPAGKVLAAAVPGRLWPEGPRHALLAALCAKNSGCSAFLLGAGSEGLTERTRALFESLGDLGIVPLSAPELGFDPRSERYVEDPGAELLAPVSIERSRAALKDCQSLPDWFMRDVIQATLRNRIEAQQAVFE